ncbi:MAG TPA: substrate-binding domain-containing protein, partial [Plasticicumulans sp.]|nr:substrate-binding domain-containing protein [Plasticicumulans sp.]
ALAADQAAASLQGPVPTLLLEGIRGAANAEARRRGALSALARHPAVQVVASESAHWKIDEAFEVAQREFSEHPELRLVVCANDMMALGVIRYLKDAGRPDVRVTGYDALPEAREALAQGWLYATVDQRAAEQGETGVRYALRALAGEVLPARTLVPVTLVLRPDGGGADRRTGER